ncbi:hypothetical protein C9F11_06160 [Streptomyces sp. YIM 121038]|uniref:hypothetical protein n=1 Tax=Streptomyces sp. YIM 121038 TaxID=2136401 RepID=UPI001110C250|nr:hypothetical protein [Streptomyces sp. YIM 121038]QCX74932.1 hypothetical protein C9F11_06160 [Streptomyces sp. YIM 121038]
MPCTTCTGHHPIPLQRFPAGDVRASLKAAHAASEERTRTDQPVHVHYDALHDTFVVLRTTTPKEGTR